MDDIAINTLAINDLVRKLRENIIKNDSNDQESLRTVDECAKSSNNFNDFLLTISNLIKPRFFIGVDTRPLEDPNKKTPVVSIPNKEVLLPPPPPPPQSSSNNSGLPPVRMNNPARISNFHPNLNSSFRAPQNMPNMKVEKHPSYLSTEVLLLNEDIFKSKIEKKLIEKGLKSVNLNAFETFNVCFSVFLKGMLSNLAKVAALEVNAEGLAGFLNQDTEKLPNYLNIIENQDLRKTLIDRTGEKVNINEIKDINFSLVSGPNKIINQKTIESIDKDEQTLLEEKVKVKKIFEEYEDKPTKKIKRTNEENKDIYDILLKNKTEKAKESETKRKEAEDTSAAVDVFLGKSNLSKMKADQKEDYALRNQNKQIKDNSKMEQKRNMSEKLRVSLKHLILCFERDPNWRRSGSLLQAYLKQN